MFRRVFQLLRSMTRWELGVLGVCSLGLLIGLVGIVRAFYIENTTLVPGTGGTYIEGSVGELQPLNPWFIVKNDVNRDIVSLVFSGLLKYDPQTRKIVDDLAMLQSSKDGKTYTLRLKDNIFWHDSTEKNPHPVTVDDVLFTFKTIQDPQFPNTILQQNYRGVHITKIDDRTVQFSLDEPYGFFPSNLTIGLLPKKLFEGIPVSKLDLASDFGFHPVGAGPYRVKNIVQTELSSEVTLERFPRSLTPVYRLDRIVFRIFTDYSTLLSDLQSLQGVRLVPRNEKGEPMIPRRFKARNYFLPQYVSLFFNLDRPKLQDQKLRLGLQLGTNKQAIADTVHETVLVDTPLLELDLSDWRYHFDSVAAQGALFASRWNMPEKIRLQHILEQQESNKKGILKVPPVVFLQTGGLLTLSGSSADVSDGFTVNNVRVKTSGSGAWQVSLPTEGTGALKIGENLIRLVDPKQNIVDSAYILRVKTGVEYERAKEEQRVMQMFLQTRAGQAPVSQQVGITGLYLENGFLRLRAASDPISVRRNERGEELVIHLLTSSAPSQYPKVAEAIRKAWAQLGVKVLVEVPSTPSEFQDRLLRRDYDVLLFGQSLLDNLDSYPYWHSSGVQKVTGDPKNLRQDAYNLSQYSSFRADALLETIRRTGNDKEREGALKELRELLKNDVPAIFLYSPLYTFAHHQNILGIELNSLSLHSDRFLTLFQWYVKEKRVFKPGVSWFSILGWFPRLLIGA